MPKRKPPIPMYFSSLEIENVRCFGKRQRLDLTSENGQPARWTLILGDNGVGKTTLLQCLAWMRFVPVIFEAGPSGKEDDSGEPPPLAKGMLGPALQEEENEILEGLLRVTSDLRLVLRAKLSFGAALSSADENAKSADERSKIVDTEVKIVFDAKRLLSRFEYRRRKIETTFRGEFHDPLIVAYGANRQLGEQNLAALDDSIATSRLSELTELYDIEEILSGLDYASKEKGDTSREYKHLKRLRDVLARILPGNIEPTAIKIFPPDVLDRPWEPSGVRLETFSGIVPISALSLGYQTTLAWTTDLAWRLMKRYPGSPNPLAEPAIVLIDEIDLHLHPLWQLRIIDDLSAIFPGTQFVATSHSPLMVQVAEAANFVLLRNRETDVEIVNDPEVIRSWRVDQILTSELFKVPRARDKETELLFRRRDELVDKPSRTPVEEAELKKLRAKISKLPTAQDPQDQKAMDFIREAAALLKKHRVAGR